MEGTPFIAARAESRAKEARTAELNFGMAFGLRTSALLQILSANPHFRTGSPVWASGVAVLVRES
jgi:hypothetical protein